MTTCTHGIPLEVSCFECRRAHGVMGCPICNAGLVEDDRVYACLACGWNHVPADKFAPLPIEEYQIKLPIYAGQWAIGGEFGIKVAMINKPNWLHRKMCQWLLGWEWVTWP